MHLERPACDSQVNTGRIQSASVWQLACGLKEAFKIGNGRLIVALGTHVCVREREGWDECKCVYVCEREGE